MLYWYSRKKRAKYSLSSFYKLKILSNDYSFWQDSLFSVSLTLDSTFDLNFKLLTHFEKILMPFLFLTHKELLLLLYEDFVTFEAATIFVFNFGFDIADKFIIFFVTTEPFDVILLHNWFIEFLHEWFVKWLFAKFLLLCFDVIIWKDAVVVAELFTKLLHKLLFEIKFGTCIGVTHTVLSDPGICCCTSEWYICAVTGSVIIPLTETGNTEMKKIQ